MFDEIWDRSELLFRLKLLKDKVDAFESGKKYVQMLEDFHRVREADLRYIKRLEKALTEAHLEVPRVRDQWYDTCVDVQKECDRLLREKDRECEAKLKEKDKELEWFRKQLERSEAEKEAAKTKLKERTEKMYAAQEELLEEKEKNAALNARINKDYTNSSKPSSQSPNHEKIHNSREKTGRKPGAQKGHIHHGRKMRKPTKVVPIEAPKKYTEDSNFKPTGREIRKQLISFRIIPEVIEFVTPEFRNQTTGQRVHADFPQGIVNDVNYDGTVKALAYMINNSLYTSVDKTRQFLTEISHGLLAVSNGFICELAEEFSNKTEDERNEIFLELATSSLMHADFTFGRMSGKQTAVAITAAGNTVLYQGREKKGDEGVKGTPLEHYDGTLVSDHESAIKKHGSRKQECLPHVARYAKGAKENEPDKTWGGRLDSWIKDSIGYWDDVTSGKIEYDTEEAEKYIDELRAIIAKAKDEYEYEPPSKYYREGYNTYKRIEEDFDEYVLFLRDTTVPPSNNICERYARKFKRKAAQVMAFRSQEGVNHFCDGLTIIESLRAGKENVYDSLSAIFNKGMASAIY